MVNSWLKKTWTQIKTSANRTMNIGPIIHCQCYEYYTDDRLYKDVENTTSIYNRTQ